jgi:putative redox protein
MENFITWIGDLGFKCKNNKHEFILDVNKEKGSQDLGATPKEALLSSTATCSAMDVIAILKKMRDLPEIFSVDVSFKTNKSHPIYFTGIHLHYKLEGKTQPKNVLKAVQSSLTKYCGVSYMISKVVKITYTVSLNHKEIGNGEANFIDPVD